MKKLILTILLFMPLILIANESKQDQDSARLIGKWKAKQTKWDITWEEPENEMLKKILDSMGKWEDTKQTVTTNTYCSFLENNIFLTQQREQDSSILKNINETSFVFKGNQIIELEGDEYGRREELHYSFKDGQLWLSYDIKETILENIRGNLRYMLQEDGETGESTDIDKILDELVFTSSCYHIILDRVEEN